jgi:tetratricopeptide (TPR) repeat protein
LVWKRHEINKKTYQKGLGKSTKTRGFVAFGDDLVYICPLSAVDHFNSGAIMKRYLPLALLAVAVFYFASTGFQCGSAETTSAKLYMQQKNWVKAEESLLKELGKNEKNEEAQFLLGQVRYELKNYLGMNEAFTNALQLGDQHKPDILRYRLSVWGSLYNQGVAYYNKGRDTAAYYDKALQAFDIAIAMEPDSANTYYVAALADYARKDIPSAINKLETAVAKDPKYLDAHRLLGQFHYAKAMQELDAKDEASSNASLQKAQQVYEKVYTLDPNNFDNIRSLIDVYERTKQTDKALKLTREAVEKDPSNKVFRYAYGAFLLRQDKYKEAAEQFIAALKVDPNYTDAEYNLGVSYLNWGVSMKEESEKKYEAERKTNKSAKEDLAYKEKFKDALPYLEKAVMTRDDDALLWQTLAKVYANLGITDKAKKALDRFDKLTRGK